MIAGLGQFLMGPPHLRACSLTNGGLHEQRDGAAQENHSSARRPNQCSAVARVAASIEARS